MSHKHDFKQICCVFCVFKTLLMPAVNTYTLMKIPHFKNDLIVSLNLLNTRI